MCFHLHSKFQLWLSLRFVISCKFCKYHIAQNIDSIWIRKWMQLIKLWTHEILSNKALFLYWCICIRFKSKFSNSNHFLKSIAILSHLKILREREKCTQIFQLTNDLLSLNIDKSLVKSESQQSLPTSVFWILFTRLSVYISSLLKSTLVGI